MNQNKSKVQQSLYHAQETVFVDFNNFNKIHQIVDNKEDYEYVINDSSSPNI